MSPTQVDEVAFNSEVLTVENGERGKRLDAFLAARIPQQSRSYFGGLCQLSMVLVGGEAAKKSVKVEEGQEVEVRFAISPELSIQGEDIPLDVRETQQCLTVHCRWSSRRTSARGGKIPCRCAHTAIFPSTTHDDATVYTPRRPFVRVEVRVRVRVPGRCGGRR